MNHTYNSLQPGVGHPFTQGFPDMDSVKAYEDKEGRNVADVGDNYASLRVIGIEGVVPK